MIHAVITILKKSGYLGYRAQDILGKFNWNIYTGGYYVDFADTIGDIIDLDLYDRVTKISLDTYRKFANENVIKKIAEFCGNNSDGLYIYGVGIFGRNIYNTLVNDKRIVIKGFIVSDTEQIDQNAPLDIKYISGIPKEDKIVVAVSDRYKGKISEILKKAGFKNVLYEY